MMRGALLILSAVALVAATDAAPAAPRGNFSGVVILNSSMPGGNASSATSQGS